MKVFYFFTFLILGCTEKEPLECYGKNFLQSNYINPNNSFENNQRTLFTTFKTSDFETPFEKSNMTCGEVLTNHFYCNICTNNQQNELKSYNNRIYKINICNDVNEFTNNVLSLIKSMTLGAEEYESFLTYYNSSYTIEELELLKKQFKKSDTSPKIRDIKIQTH